MLTMFLPSPLEHRIDDSLRDLRRESQRIIQKKRRETGSSISRREYEHRQRRKQIAKSSQKRNRRLH